MKQFKFELDCNGKTENVKKHWQFCVGSGHAALAQRADYVQQLKIVHDELGIERVRFHGIFDDDMNVCVRLEDHLPLRIPGSRKIFNFYQVGRVYDNLLSVGMKPFVEISFMPSALASGKKTIFHYKGNVTLPKKTDQWQQFIREFAEFLIDRYGIDEVSSWYFEIWNEPDLSCFFKGTMKDYFRLYADTVSALKGVSEKLKVGGPATTAGKHITEFLDFCKRENVPVDFISTHQYPTDALGHAINGERLKAIRKLKKDVHTNSLRSMLQPIFDNVNDFSNKLKGYMKREAERVREEAGNLPLYYTEWSISSNCVAEIHDKPAAASFLVKTVLDSQGIVDGSSYWTFSDIFEELFFFADPFCGGFGLMTIDAIKKPTFYVMKMLAALPDKRYALPITDDDVEKAAFCDDAGNVYIMLYAQNFTGNCGEYSAVIKLKNAPDFSEISVERVGKGSGDPFSIWEEMGKPAVLSIEETERIKQNSQPFKGNLDAEKINTEKSVEVKLADNDVIMLIMKR